MNKPHDKDRRLYLLHRQIAMLLGTPDPIKLDALAWFAYRESMVATEPLRLILHEVS